MKKILLFSLSILALSVSSYAQDEDAEKALKNASKAYTAYNIDPQGNKAKLDEAKKAIDIACAGAPTNATTKAWITKGQIYGEYATQDDVARALKKIDKSMYPDAPFTAYSAYKKAFELAQKKWEKSDALKGIMEVAPKLQNAGADKFSEKNFKGAYDNFNAVVDANQMLKANGEKAILDENNLNIYVYYAALSAQNAEMYADAEGLYKKLVASKFELKESPAATYSGLYNTLAAQKKEDEAVKVLEEGVKLYPNDTEMLFAQINYYLKNNKLNDLIEKLKTAISKEPNNAGLYSTLGNVYENLSQIEAKNNNSTKADEYTKNAESYYSQAVEKDPKSFDAIYSLGAMYYNKAAATTTEMNKLQDDLSAAGIKKYDALKAKMDGYFAQALPYFKKAEGLNPNDRNTLTAIKEIVVRQGDLKVGDEMKARIDNIDAGKKNDKSYFSN